MKLKSNTGLKKPVAKKPVTKQVKKEAPKDYSKRIAEIDTLISKKKQTISDLNVEIGELLKERIELEIYPHKLGDTVVAEVQVGKTRKKTECVLEMSEHGTLYVRPFKSDGELSGRRFSLCPTGKITYKDLIE